MGSPENPNKNERNTVQTNTHASMHTVTTEKEAMTLKESKEGSMGVSGGRGQGTGDSDQTIL